MLFMALPWRSRKSSLKITKLAKTGPPCAEASIPAHFRCPVSLDLMRDPVTTSTGITYDRHCIESWLELGKTTCPVTGQELMETEEEDLIPNHSIRKMIQDWCVANWSLGIERIPTPKIPVTKGQVVDALSELTAGSRRGDRARCERSVAKVKNWARKSERNRRCVASNGATRALAAAFSAIASNDSSDVSDIRVLEEILAVLAMLLPLDDEATSHMAGSLESLSRLVSILKHGDLAARLNAALAVRELLASGSAARVDAIAGTKGLVEALVRLIKKPISSHATKASLVSIFYMVNSNETTASRVVDMGLVPVLVEALVDGERSMCEKALAALDGLLSWESGRERAYGHALAVPVLAKKMFRVSDMATEFVVSAMWKLLKKNCEGGEESGEGRERCLLEALQVGAFQKVLLLLQVGCSEATKERATNLIKLLDGYSHRGRQECVDTMDFRGLKKPSSI